MRARQNLHVQKQYSPIQTFIQDGYKWDTKRVHMSSRKSTPRHTHLAHVQCLSDAGTHKLGVFDPAHMDVTHQNFNRHSHVKRAVDGYRSICELWLQTKHCTQIQSLGRACITVQTCCSQLGHPHIHPSLPESSLRASTDIFQILATFQLIIYSHRPLTGEKQPTIRGLVIQ